MNISQFRLLVGLVLFCCALPAYGQVPVRPNGANRAQQTPATTQQQPVQQKPANKSEFDFSAYKNLRTFRSIPWGADKAFVLDKDRSTRKETANDYLVLAAELGNLRVDVTYFFWRGHFIKGTYLTTDNLSDYATYLERYRYLRDLLANKYGMPQIDHVNWIDLSFKNRPDKWLHALSRGHLEHLAYWQEDKVVISIKLTSFQDRPVIKIEYFIENFDEERDRTDNTDILKDL